MTIKADAFTTQCQNLANLYPTQKSLFRIDEHRIRNIDIPL